MWERSDIQWVRIVRPGRDNTPVENFLRVERINFALFATDVGALIVEVSADNLEFDEILDIRDRLRRAYSPYFEEGRPGHAPYSVEWGDKGPAGEWKASINPAPKDADPTKCPDMKGYLQNLKCDRPAPPTSEHWKQLLPQGLEFAHVIDDRIPLLSYLALSSPRDLSRGNMMRLAFVDRPDTRPLPYGESFSREFEKTYCYDRFWGEENPDLTTRFLCSGYAFTVIGRNEPGFFANPTSGMLAHFRHHYLYLGLIAILHRASLLVFSDRLARVVEDPKGKEFGNRVLQLEGDFAYFVSRFWFSEVSNQVQGLELFDWWTGLLRTPRLFAEVQDEIRAAAAIENTRRSAELNHRALSLTIIATGGLGASLGAALLTLNLKWPYWEGPTAVGWVAAGLCLILLPLALAGAANWYITRKRPKNG